MSWTLCKNLAFPASTFTDLEAKCRNKLRRINKVREAEKSDVKDSVMQDSPPKTETPVLPGAVQHHEA